MATLADIAQAAGVSTSTASRVLNQSKLSERISRACAERVRAAAEEAGYIGGYHRRALRTQRSETLGMALEIYRPGEAVPPGSGFDSFYFQQLTAGVESATHEAGYNLQLIVPSHKNRATVRGVKQLRERRIDGLVVPHANATPQNTVVLAESPRLPIAVVQPSVQTELPSIFFNHARAAELAVEHVAQLGHRHVAWFAQAPKADEPYRQSRANGFMRAAHEHGLQAGFCEIDPSDKAAPDGSTFERLRESAEQQLEAYLAEPRKLTAILCENDLIAVAACRVLIRRGLRVPQDVSVVGIDNVDPTMGVIRLTSVDHHLALMAKTATNIVLEMINGEDSAIEKYRGYTTTIEPALHVRESTGPAQKV